MCEVKSRFKTYERRFVPGFYNQQIKIYRVNFHPLLVQNYLQVSAERYPNKIALVCDGQRLTYTDIDFLTNHFAEVLIDNGVRRGDRIVIYLRNSVELVVGIFGVLKAGATFVVINPSTKVNKLINILKDCQATGLFYDLERIKINPEYFPACSFKTSHK